MRIGVDGSCWANERGYGRFTRELCTAMVRCATDEEFLFYVDDRAAKCFELRAPNVQLQVVRLGASPTEAASADGARSPVDMLRMSRAVWSNRPDVFFSPSVYTYFPLPPRLPSVVTIHDTIAERFPHLTLPTRKARLFWKLKVGLAIKQCKRVLTVSEYSARQIQETLDVPRDRIRVASEAPAPAFQPSSHPDQITEMAERIGLPRDARWFIYVGGFNPHKNVDLLVRAHAEVAASESQPVHLLLVGTTTGDVFHGDQGRIQAVIAQCGTQETVHWTGFLPDEELRHLHSGALALVLPSACEGFGLPAVEAAACGAPVIATRESPLPEVLEGGGLFIEPGDQRVLKDAMWRMVIEQGTREKWALEALRAARALSWETGARAALDALRESVS